MESCAPSPVCVDQKYNFDISKDDMIVHSQFLGNASKYDWLYSGYPKIDDENNLVMKMPEGSSTLVANNHYIWYGKVKGKMKSSRGQGVVTSFILMSDVLDEIDFEFVGDDLHQVESNYYFQGVLDCMWQISCSCIEMLTSQGPTASRLRSRATPLRSGTSTSSTGAPSGFTGSSMERSSAP